MGIGRGTVSIHDPPLGVFLDPPLGWTGFEGRFLAVHASVRCAVSPIFSCRRDDPAHITANRLSGIAAKSLYYLIVSLYTD